MRRFAAALLIVLGVGGILATQSTGTASAQSRHAALAKIDGVIQRTSANFLERAIDDATDAGAEVLIVQIDTPGGLLSSTRDIVEKIFAAEIPIVAYVSPPGARAASARRSARRPAD